MSVRFRYPDRISLRNGKRILILQRRVCPGMAFDRNTATAWATYPFSPGAWLMMDYGAGNARLSISIRCNQGQIGATRSP